MAPKKDTPTNARLKALRDKTGLIQAEFGKKYFRVSLPTYFRYEATKYHKQLPGPVQILLEKYEEEFGIR